MKVIIALIGFSLPLFSFAEIPIWYMTGINEILKRADSVVVYRVLDVKYQSRRSLYFSYRINTSTTEILKGQAPKGECYFIHTEGEWEQPYKVGDEVIVILATKLTGECGVIEPGYAAPGTVEYVSLFKSILE